MKNSTLHHALTYLTLIEGTFGLELFVGEDEDWNKFTWAEDGVPSYQIK